MGQAPVQIINENNQFFIFATYYVDGFFHQAIEFLRR